MWSEKLRNGSELKQFINHVFYCHTLNMISLSYMFFYAGWNIINPGPDAVSFQDRLSFSGKLAKHMQRLCLGLEGWNGYSCCHHSSSNTAFSYCQYYRLEWCKYSAYLLLKSMPKTNNHTHFSMYVVCVCYSWCSHSLFCKIIRYKFVWLASHRGRGIRNTIHATETGLIFASSEPFGLWRLTLPA